MTIEFIIYFAVLAYASVGLGKLYLMLFNPIEWLKNRNTFLYKSLGGCEICTIQRFADLTYILLLFLHPINAWLWVPFYILFGGLVHYALGEKVVVKNTETKINL